VDFLDLLEWEPEASELPEKHKNKGGYEPGHQAVAGRLLRAARNRRFYGYLGVEYRVVGQALAFGRYLRRRSAPVCLILAENDQQLARSGINGQRS
jgi:hypothetical protein